MVKFFSGLFDSNKNELSKIDSFVNKINALAPEYEKLTADELKAKTAEFKARIAEATAEQKQRIDDARKEIAAAREQPATIVENDLAAKEFAQQVAAERTKSIEEEITRLENESRKKEAEVLDKLLPEAFAAIREAAYRTIKQRHFDVQLMGGIVLHQGRIAEMKTGEGKTLTATLPLYLNALTGRGCHLVTVNDYLARRDPNWMGPVFYALGLSVACIYSQTPDNQAPSFRYDPDYVEEGKSDWHLKPVTRKQAYEADITYGTNNEFGFDYLRDNMVPDLSMCVQRDLNYAIVDEVDNLLIDEARTPLIISGMPEKSGDEIEKENQEKQAAQFVLRLKGEKRQQTPLPSNNEDEGETGGEDNNGHDYRYYEKEQLVILTGSGEKKLAEWFHTPNLYHNPEREEEYKKGEFGEYIAEMEPPEISILKQRIDNALRAKEFFHIDQQYTITPEGKVVIVDEFTGRLMHGRRYEGGLHEAIEAKEGIKTQQLSKTFATITFQNYFRMYKRLSGMTGTAVTEAEEFNKIYKLEVVLIPTNKPLIRDDQPDVIYKTEKGKFAAVAKDVADLQKKGQPVLIGTVSIEKSEYLSDILKRKGVTHQVLNAKNHEKEAGIHAEAGKPGAVTVATNMAGRGVDIILGGKQPDAEDEKAWREWQERHEKVITSGGLRVIGTERHEARRIDNQLRGRAGRQGDPGSTRFYISLEDDIVRRFGGDKMKGLLGWAGMDDETPLENAMISRMIADVQKRVEGYNFDIRKHLVEYDDVVNKHREIHYADRRKIIAGADLKSNILSMLEKTIRKIVASHFDARGIERNEAGLLKETATIFPVPQDITAESLGQLSRKEIEDKLTETANLMYDKREKAQGILDKTWSDNLVTVGFISPKEATDFSDKPVMRLLEKKIMLNSFDRMWVEHLTLMDEMRLGIGMEAVAQRDPLVAYKNRGNQSFQTLQENIADDVVHKIYFHTIPKVIVKAAPSPMAKAANRDNINKPAAPTGNKRPGRNDPCTCGSGKKYKHCCGK